MNEKKFTKGQYKPRRVSKIIILINMLCFFFQRLFSRFRKSEMEKWAEREIEIACKHERAGSEKKKGWDYGCAYYESALKAFKCLLKDDHSGYSICVTKNILNRLINEKPLSPIEDTDDAWNDLTDPRKDRITYQCKRMSSLFKDVFNDKSKAPVYTDVDAYCCIDMISHAAYNSGLVQHVMDEMFPIKMPYMPHTNATKVYCEDFLTDKKNGDFDTVGIFYAIKSNGDKIEINRYFKDADTKTGWAEIDHDEYMERKKQADDLKEKMIKQNFESLKKATENITDTLANGVNQAAKDATETMTKEV